MYLPKRKMTARSCASTRYRPLPTQTARDQHQNAAQALAEARRTLTAAEAPAAAAAPNSALKRR